MSRTTALLRGVPRPDDADQQLHDYFQKRGRT
jgi:hypothetical protein